MGFISLGCPKNLVDGEVMLGLARDSAGALSLRALTRPGDTVEDWFRIGFERQLAAGNVAEARALLAAAGLP